MSSALLAYRGREACDADPFLLLEIAADVQRTLRDRLEEMVSG
jgi:hypothetical protein